MAMKLTDFGSTEGGSMVVDDPETPRTIRTSGPTEQVFAREDGRVRVLMHPMFVNTYVIFASPNLLTVIDPGLKMTADLVVEAARAWLGEALWDSCVLDTVIYTHGHADHAFGTHAWVSAGKPPRQIVAHENVRERLSRYRRMRGWNGKINKIQFSLSSAGEEQGEEGEESAESNAAFFDTEGVLDPTTLFRDAMRIAVGGELELLLQHHKGETDDATVILAPRYGLLFTGDLVIWQACNCGNPQKVQRYCLLWARALQWMAAGGASLLLPGHGFAVRGADAIKGMLLNTSRYLLHLEDQTVALMNSGVAPEEIAERVQPDAALARLPYLQAGYDHPTFIVRNILRLYGGWWNGDPAALLPAPAKEVAGEVVGLAGGVGPVVARGEALLREGRLRLAAHLAVFATRAAPKDAAAQALKAKVFEALMHSEKALMAQGIYRDTANQARQVLHLAKL